ncbi:MAG TPA: Lpg1974 family pore-forming outer membrane protein [Chlamydiales bacterium]|nr:Lpg1974 family pore-forming outer membrane protein [Chlamydiales bacterium]
MNLACPRDFYFHVDGLAMQPKQDGMDWAMSDTNGVGAPLTHGKVVGFSNEHKDWSYNWGMRLGAGFYLDHDAWNLDFNWTWVKISDYKRANVSTGGGALLPFWAVGIDSAVAMLNNQMTSAVWDGNYNTIDIKLAKPYHVSRYLVLSPHWGLRGGWINQHFSVDYSGTVGATNNRYVHHADNDFWGVGARAGLNSDWLLGKGFCLFGNTAMSMLYGKFDIDQHLATPAAQYSGVNNGFDVDADHYMNVPNLEIILGLGWGQHFDKNRYHVGLRAAYEFHYWWNQLNLRRFWSGNFQGAGVNTSTGGSYTNDVVSRGDFSLSGFSLSLQFDM